MQPIFNNRRRIPKPHLTLDSYKVDHRVQYPEGTEVVYSNLTARSAAHARMPSSFDNKVVLFGVQGFCLDFLIDQWNVGFFNRPKDVVVAEYKRRIDNFLGPDAITVDHIAALHDLGYLPICIKSLPEGSRVDIKVPFLTVYNTLPGFFWLTNYLETVMSNELWKQCTVATITFEYRRILDKYIELTGADPAFADWQIHDFSMRGMSGSEDAAKCGAAHLLSSFGSDTLPAIDYLEDLYFADVTQELVAGSVPATEHSVMCMGGLGEAELETFRRLITKVYPSGIVSIVSDTWDFWKVITEYSAILKEEILARKENALGQAKVVFRPDSGDPVKIVAGLTVFNGLDISGVEYPVLLDGEYDVVAVDGKYYEFEVDWENGYDGDTWGHRIVLKDEVPEHVVKGAVECLWDIFGGTGQHVETKHADGTKTLAYYRNLNQRVGLIYGDSITLERCEAILKRLADKGFSASNIVFGVGSFTYQYITRDTFGMAMKATYGVVNGVGREIFKDPATDIGAVKKSAKGLLCVDYDDVSRKFVLYDQQDKIGETLGQLKEVFRDGKMVKVVTLAEVRATLQASK